MTTYKELLNPPTNAERRLEQLAHARVDAVLMRAGLLPNDETNPYRDRSLLEHARDLSGLKPGAAVHETIRAAQSTSQYQHILSAGPARVLQMGFDETPEIWPRMTSRGVLKDFREYPRVAMDQFPALQKVEEGGFYEAVKRGDYGQIAALGTFGRIFSVTREAIINDDLNALVIAPRDAGRAAKRLVGDLVHAVLTDNPLMSDGKALFHADHGNILSPASISTDSVSAMRAAMALQRDFIDPNRVTNARLGALVVPVAQSDRAALVRKSQSTLGWGFGDEELMLIEGGFQILPDARLDIISDRAWYGVADPKRFSGIEVGFLEGSSGRPRLEILKGFDRETVDFKVSLDCSVQALDWRNLAVNNDG
ncbi:MAG: hypothetical protein IT494_07445 [Gammaproteobacteria bacterium]|nr:hypothetical protein [Gammaproteobacteria bacterium]